MEREEGEGTMMKVTVKTLDSQNHEFTINGEMLVKDFKAEISSKINIPVDQQRLIFRGRVLHDDKEMKEYNVANSTVHVVQRPPNANPTRRNDEPNPSLGQRGPGEGVHGGLIIAAQTGPLPNLGSRTSAAARLQASNRFLSQASAILRRLEEDVPPPPPPAPLNDAMELGDEEEEIEGVELHIQDGANLGNILTQMTGAASVASLTGGSVGAVVGSNNNNNNNGHSHPRPAVVLAPTTVNTTGNTMQMGSNTGTPTRQGGRRPESPRLREMATVIEGILTFHDRFVPYLRYLGNELRENRNYTETEERDSVQYLFNTLSLITHWIGHSYHALSDMICDFSTPADTRRLRAATAILLETSTVLRTSIPIPVAVPVSGGGYQLPIPTSTSGTNAASVPLQNPRPSAGPGDSGVPPPPPGAVPPGPQSRGPPMQVNIAQAIGQQLQQMFAGGQGGLHNVGFGGAHIQVEIGGPGPGPGDQPGQPVSMQNLANVLGPMGFMVNQQQHQQQQGIHQQQQSETQNPTPAPGPGIMLNPQGQPQGSGAPNNIRLQPGGGPDLLLPCNSHHGWRPDSGSRPAGFSQVINVASTQTQPTVPPSCGTAFLETLLDTALQSNVVDLARPILRDVITNYLMRGRDPKNKEHLKSCAKKLSRSVVSYFMKFTERFEGRDKKVDYVETYTGLVTEFLADIFHLTVTLPPSADGYQFQSFIMTSLDGLMRKLMTIFKKCLSCPSNSYPVSCTEYLVETMFGGCSLAIQENIRSTLRNYFASKLVMCCDDNVPFLVMIKEEPRSGASTLGAAGTSSTPYTSPRPSASTNKESPEVVPPKQSKQSDSPAAAMSVPLPTPVRMDEDDDLDDMIAVSRAPQQPAPQQSAQRFPFPNATMGLGGGGRGQIHNFEEALSNIPSDWVDTVRHDISRQLGMPEQPPFSPAYNALLSKK